uniref:Protein tyrosine phosphatase receptor type Na n=1 Tax=Neogobius melanostomus TaxID=47308 RepID=A0A8C6TD19_9GOBI
MGLSEKYGCLFERKLCSREQFCSDDGLFGQCRTSKQDQVQYQVSVPVLKRMQEVLKQLMQQGLSWQDDITQYILSKELKRVPHSTQAAKPNSSSSQPPYPHSNHHKSVSSPGGNYVDYMIVEPPQSPLRMQHRYQEDVERSLIGPGGGYARPSSRAQANRERERDRQLLQEALSLYLASGQPSYRHRGAAPMTLPYYDDLELEIPLDYVEDYTIEERIGAGRQPAVQSKKAPQDFNSMRGKRPSCSQRGTQLSPNLKCLKYARSFHRSILFILQLIKSDSATGKAERPAPVPVPPNAPPATSAFSAPATSPAKTSGPPLPASPPPLSESGPQEQKPPLVEGTGAKEEYGYIVTNRSVVGPALTFRIRQNEHNMTAAEVAAKAVSEKNFLESETGLKIVQTGVGERTDARGLPQVSRVSQGSSGTVVTLVSMAIVGGVLVLAMGVACFRHYAQQVANGKLGLGPEAGAETHFDYQELCRQHMASKSSLCRQDCVAGVSGGAGSVSSQFSDGPQHSPSSTHSSTPSWSEEPAQSNMDISTGHMILAYMEDHLRNKDRLQKEWEALCSYQAEPSSVAVGQEEINKDKNRYAESIPYDHTRVKLKTEMNPNKQDYINASAIFDHDPRQPSYIATQGPLPHTVADFWQMVWENGCTVIVMMTALVEDGEKQCERYWPDEGSSLYHIYEVNLVSEHIWCKDFLVRSFYLKNVQTQETRTLTQFHLLSWPADGIPTSTRPLLDFRRKVNKCYRGRSCPIIVHCNDGIARTGTYILIDMVLNRMAKGVKEIDIAAALEHIRDQRPGLVRTKDQFEFALTAVAEEVNAILKALPQ